MSAGSPRHQALLAALVAAIAIAVLWWNGRRLNRSASPAPAVPSETAPSGAELPPSITVLPVALELSEALLDTDGPPEAELDAVGQLLYFHRQAFGENPVGDNGDIVAALSGLNAKQAAWIAPGCDAVVNGLLVDRWGSPYWFHAISGREMEIRSAGPDREQFTADDLLLTPVSR